MNTRPDWVTSVDDVRAYLGHLMQENRVLGIEISEVNEGGLTYSNNLGVANVEHHISNAQYCSGPSATTSTGDGHGA